MDFVVRVVGATFVDAPIEVLASLVSTVFSNVRDGDFHGGSIESVGKLTVVVTDVERSKFLVLYFPICRLETRFTTVSEAVLTLSMPVVWIHVGDADFHLPITKWGSGV